MKPYVLCVITYDDRDEMHKVAASLAFSAHDDLVSIEIASTVFEALADVFCDYWLWAEHNRLVATSRQRRCRMPRMDLSAVRTQIHHSIAKLEDDLLTTHAGLVRARQRHIGPWHTKS